MLGCIKNCVILEVGGATSAFEVAVYKSAGVGARAARSLAPRYVQSFCFGSLSVPCGSFQTLFSENWVKIFFVYLSTTVVNFLG